MLVLRIIQELWQSSGGVFNVDEVVVFHENPQGDGSRTTRFDPNQFLCTILTYLDTPQ